eukprot:1189191-Prorocentrum_minimum.AAC.5
MKPQAYLQWYLLPDALRYWELPSQPARLLVRYNHNSAPRPILQKVTSGWVARVAYYPSLLGACVWSCSFLIGPPSPGGLRGGVLGACQHWHDGGADATHRTVARSRSGVRGGRGGQRGGPTAGSRSRDGLRLALRLLGLRCTP